MLLESTRCTYKVVATVDLVAVITEATKITGLSPGSLVVDEATVRGAMLVDIYSLRR